jgi:hypothetical protein
VCFNCRGYALNEREEQLLPLRDIGRRELFVFRGDAADNLKEAESDNIFSDEEPFLVGR